MTSLLASVTTVEEARLALELGADIIDLKNPAQGALGALPPARLREIVATVAGRAPVSATVGDLPMQPTRIEAAVTLTAATGVDIVKFGVFEAAGAYACVDALASEARRIKLVAVLFADREPDFGLVASLAERHFYGVMLDTADKRGGGLRHHLDAEALRRFVSLAHEAELVCGLAGSLRVDDIAALLPLAPDYLGFRGALCERAERESALSRTAFATVRGRIPRGEPWPPRTGALGTAALAAKCG